MAGIKGFKAVLIVLAGVLLLLGASPVWADDNNECINCHTNPDRLKGLVGDTNPALTASPPNRLSSGGAIKPVERWQKVYIDPSFLDDENHGRLGCQKCHGGDPTATDFNIVHKGVDYEPSYPEPSPCAECHEESLTVTNGLHYNIAGMEAPIMARAGDDPEARSKVDRGFKANCARCHATCGSCHVSRPVHVGGGFKSGHAFIKTPETDTTCVACHGSTVSEFQGLNQGAEKVEKDIHSENGMDCLDCHTVEQMHGDENKYPNRYASGGPKCVDCHEDIYSAGAENKEAHSLHKDRVSCQVCHAQAYTHCADCHLTQDWDKEKYTEWTGFKIGLNSNPTERHPEKVVTVRHVPISQDTFAPLAEGAMPNYAAQPTWKMATPHTIRRQTPQNAQCNNCHGVQNIKLYLTRPDVDPKDRGANRPVIVEPARIPAPVAAGPEEKKE